MSNWNFHINASGNNHKQTDEFQNDIINYISVFFDPVIPLLGIYPREIQKNIHTLLYKNAHSSCSHNSKKAEKAKILFKEEWTNCGLFIQSNTSWH